MAPILLDFRHEFRTERLTIRCPMPGDGMAINEAVRESVDSFKQWFPFVQTVPTVEDSETDPMRQQECQKSSRCRVYLEATLITYDGVDTSGQVKDTLVYAKVRLANGDLGYVL